MEECLAIMNSLNSRFGDDFLLSLDFSLLKGAFASILFEMFLKQTFFFFKRSFRFTAKLAEGAEISHIQYPWSP